MGILAIDIDGYHAWLATLHGGRVRALPGALARRPLAVAHKGDTLVFGEDATKRLVTDPGNTVVGLGAMVGAPPKVIEHVSSWRGTKLEADAVGIGGTTYPLAELTARALDHYIAPALFLFDEPPSKVVVTVRQALTRGAAWAEVLSKTDVDAEIVDRSLAAIQATRSVRGLERVAVVEVDRMGISVRVLRRTKRNWRMLADEEVAEEGVEAVDQRVVALLRERGGVPEGPNTFAMLRRAAGVLRSDLEGGTTLAIYPMPYSALGGTSDDHLQLETQELDRAYDAVIRALRRCCVRVANAIDVELEAVVLHGEASKRKDVQRTVEDVFHLAPERVRVPVVMGAPLVASPDDVDDTPLRPMKARAAPPRVRYSAQSRRRPSSPALDPLLHAAPTPTPSTPPGAEEKTPTIIPPKPSVRPAPRMTRPPAAPTVPPEKLAELPRDGTFVNPRSPEELLQVNLKAVDEPSSLPQLVFACVRGRLSGTLELDVGDRDILALAYDEGQPRWPLRDRQRVVEGLKKSGGSYRIDETPRDAARLARPESVHAVMTDAIRKLVWTFDEGPFHSAFADRRHQAPRALLNEESTLLRRGFRREEIRFIKVACTGEESLDELLTRSGLGRRGMLCVVTLLDLYGYLDWS